MHRAHSFFGPWELTLLPCFTQKAAAPGAIITLQAQGDLAASLISQGVAAHCTRTMSTIG